MEGADLPAAFGFESGGGGVNSGSHLMGRITRIRRWPAACLEGRPQLASFTSGARLCELGRIQLKCCSLSPLVSGTNIGTREGCVRRFLESGKFIKGRGG